jgi:hypothetical protein
MKEEQNKDIQNIMSELNETIAVIEREFGRAMLVAERKEPGSINNASETVKAALAIKKEALENLKNSVLEKIKKITSTFEKQEIERIETRWDTLQLTLEKQQKNAVNRWASAYKAEQLDILEEALPKLVDPTNLLEAQERSVFFLVNMPIPDEILLLAIKDNSVRENLKNVYTTYPGLKENITNEQGYFDLTKCKGSQQQIVRQGKDIREELETTFLSTSEKIQNISFDSRNVEDRLKKAVSGSNVYVPGDGVQQIFSTWDGTSIGNYSRG